MSSHATRRSLVASLRREPAMEASIELAAALAFAVLSIYAWATSHRHARSGENLLALSGLSRHDPAAPRASPRQRRARRTAHSRPTEARTAGADRSGYHLDVELARGAAQLRC